jgi:hypothetical protein
MKCVAMSAIVVAGAVLAGCSEQATKTGFLTKNAEFLQCYCASNAATAETALLGLVRYTEQCQKEGVNGILYDEVFAHTYARLCVVEQHLRKSQAAEEYSRRALEHYQRSGLSIRQRNLSAAMVHEPLEAAADPGLIMAWRRR